MTKEISIMTQLAQFLGNIIRERGGWLPTNDNDSWLEEKAREIESLVRTPRYKVGDVVEIYDILGNPVRVKVARVEETEKMVKCWDEDGYWFADRPSRLITEE